MRAGTLTCYPYARSTSRAQSIGLRYRPRGNRSSLSGLIVIAIIGSGTCIERFGAVFDMGLEGQRSVPRGRAATRSARVERYWGLY